MTVPNSYSSGKATIPMWLTVTGAAIVSGILDGLAAIIVYGPVFGHAGISQIFRGIASAIFGRMAFSAMRFTFYGILLHFMIAFLFSAAYGIVYARVSSLRKNWLRNGTFYGVAVWIVMNKLVLPLFGMSGPSTVLAVARGMAILVLCVGIPVAWITWFTQQKLNK